METITHQLDCNQIDELDEIDDDGQCCLVWCNTCRRYEGWFLPLNVIGRDVILSKPGPAKWKGYRP